MRREPRFYAEFLGGTGTVLRPLIGCFGVHCLPEGGGAIELAASEYDGFVKVRGLHTLTFVPEASNVARVTCAAPHTHGEGAMTGRVTDPIEHADLEEIRGLVRAALAAGGRERTAVLTRLAARIRA
jgi:hypothetical protein